MHFFKAATKMFYGGSSTPKPGTPPPLCYLSGFGTYQYNKHPVAIINFSYTLPNDVDYIRTTTSYNSTPTNGSGSNISSQVNDRLGNISQGGLAPSPHFSDAKYDATFINPNTNVSTETTYVPTKITLNIQLSPVVSRNKVSTKFNFADYASGKLLKGGMW